MKPGERQPPGGGRGQEAGAKDTEYKSRDQVKGGALISSLTDDEILEAIAYQIRVDRDYRRQLEVAVQSKNDEWIRRLVRSVIGATDEIGRAVLAAITGWFLPRSPAP